MTRHTPETPLPWTVLESGCTLRDHAYQIHAANAYPKLVEALQRVANDGCVGIVQMAFAASLLRELGEEE